MDRRSERMNDLKCRLVQLMCLSFFICATSCAANKTLIVRSYEDALKLPDLIVAVPRGQDSKPVWIQALITTTSQVWCEKGKRVRLPDGNEWKSDNGFLCTQSKTDNAFVFQEIRRKNPGWKFRWSCAADEPSCMVKK